MADPLDLGHPSGHARLQGLVPARVHQAQWILSLPAAAGGLGAAFGLGGVAGSFAYAWLGRRSSDARWVAVGACGIVVLATGWVPGTLAAMAVARFASNLVSVILKTLVGAAFALGAGPRAAFAVVGAGLGVVALGQFFLAAKLSRPREAGVLLDEKAIIA